MKLKINKIEPRKLKSLLIAFIILSADLTLEWKTFSKMDSNYSASFDSFCPKMWMCSFLWRESHISPELSHRKIKFKPSKKEAIDLIVSFLLGRKEYFVLGILNLCITFPKL